MKINIPGNLLVFTQGMLPPYVIAGWTFLGEGAPHSLPVQTSVFLVCLYLYIGLFGYLTRKKRNEGDKWSVLTLYQLTYPVITVIRWFRSTLQRLKESV